MCFSASTMLAMQAGSSILQGSLANREAKTQAGMLESQALAEKDTGRAQAERILRATRRERGAARAAIAASGTALDEFALTNEREIQDIGETDAAMAILSGDRQALATRQQADAVRQSGRNQFLSGFLRAGGTYSTGWRGAKEATDPIGSFMRGTRGTGD